MSFDLQDVAIAPVLENSLQNLVGGSPYVAHLVNSMDSSVKKVLVNSHAISNFFKSKPYYNEFLLNILLCMSCLQGRDKFDPQKGSQLFKCLIDHFKVDFINYIFNVELLAEREEIGSFFIHGVSRHVLNVREREQEGELSICLDKIAGKPSNLSDLTDMVFFPQLFADPSRLTGSLLTFSGLGFNVPVHYDQEFMKVLFENSVFEDFSVFLYSLSVVKNCPSEFTSVKPVPIFLHYNTSFFYPSCFFKKDFNSHICDGGVVIKSLKFKFTQFVPNIVFSNLGSKVGPFYKRIELFCILYEMFTYEEKYGNQVNCSPFFMSNFSSCLDSPLLNGGLFSLKNVFYFKDGFLKDIDAFKKQLLMEFDEKESGKYDSYHNPEIFKEFPLEVVHSALLNTFDPFYISREPDNPHSFSNKYLTYRITNKHYGDRYYLHNEYLYYDDLVIVHDEKFSDLSKLNCFLDSTKKEGKVFFSNIRLNAYADGLPIPILENFYSYSFLRVYFPSQKVLCGPIREKPYLSLIMDMKIKNYTDLNLQDEPSPFILSKTSYDLEMDEFFYDSKVQFCFLDITSAKEMIIKIVEMASMQCEVGLLYKLFVATFGVFPEYVSFYKYLVQKECSSKRDFFINLRRYLMAFVFPIKLFFYKKMLELRSSDTRTFNLLNNFLRFLVTDSVTKMYNDFLNTNGIRWHYVSHFVIHTAEKFVTDYTDVNSILLSAVLTELVLFSFAGGYLLKLSCETSVPSSSHVNDFSNYYKNQGNPFIPMPMSSVMNKWKYDKQDLGVEDNYFGKIDSLFDKYPDASYDSLDYIVRSYAKKSSYALCRYIKKNPSEFFYSKGK